MVVLVLRMAFRSEGWENNKCGQSTKTKTPRQVFRWICRHKQQRSSYSRRHAKVMLPTLLVAISLSTMVCPRLTDDIRWYSISSFIELNLTTHRKYLPAPSLNTLKCWIFSWNLEEKSMHILREEREIICMYIITLPNSTSFIFCPRTTDEVLWNSIKSFTELYLSTQR